MKRKSIIVALAIGLSVSLVCRAEDSPMPSLDKAARNEVAAAAKLAIRKHVQESLQKKNDNEIAKEFWGEAIVRLKLLRVWNDRMNVFIVLKEDEKAEEGLYVSNPVSSYAPGGDKKRFLLFEKLTQPDDGNFGTLYHCKILKAEPGTAPKK